MEGFCRSQNSLHGSDARAFTPYRWVSNSPSLWPDQSARPFHKPVHGLQAPVLSRSGLHGFVDHLLHPTKNRANTEYGGGEASYQAKSTCPLSFSRFLTRQSLDGSKQLNKPGRDVDAFFWGFLEWRERNKKFQWGR